MRIVSVVLCLFLAACDSRSTMRDEFGDGVAVEVTDKQGNRFVITHNLGDAYNIRPIK